MFTLTILQKLKQKHLHLTKTKNQTFAFFIKANNQNLRVLYRSDN